MRIFAEDDKEAVFDADQEFNSRNGLQHWPYEVALFCGRRKVKTYKDADPGRYVTETV